MIICGTEGCKAEIRLKPVPGAVGFPRRPECPVHGYIFQERHSVFSALTAEEADAENAKAAIDELHGDDKE